MAVGRSINWNDIHASGQGTLLIVANGRSESGAMKAWHITAHPKGSTIWKTVWEYGMFATQEEAFAYIREQLRDVTNVELHPAMGGSPPWPASSLP